MRRADEAGLRPGWRGTVAYAASPWLWREGSFRAFVVVMTAFSVVWIGGGIAEASSIRSKILNGLFNAGLCALVVGGPLVRASHRRSEPTSD